MCGRFLLISPPAILKALFRYQEQPNFPERYNIAPTQPIAAVRLFEGARQFALLRWGLIPGWVKDSRTFSLVFNARGEPVAFAITRPNAGSAAVPVFTPSYAAFPLFATTNGAAPGTLIGPVANTSALPRAPANGTPPCTKHELMPVPMLTNTNGS